jgi:Mn2+/Fe2+ NRAMP family transporter
VCTLSFIILAALMGLLGLLGNVVSIWSGTWGFLDHAIPSAWACVGISVFLYLLLLVGRISFFEKVLAVLVAIMGVTFLYTMIISANSLELADFAKGFIPKIPDLAEGSDNSPGVIIAGMVGTTVSVFAFVIRSILVKQAGWKLQDQATQKHDALISVALMFVISAAIMITAAATLFKSGLKVNNIGEMIPMLEPFFGAGALSLFVFGILAAGISSHLPNLLVIPWLLLDLKGGNRDLRSAGVRLTLLALTIWATAMASLGYKPVFIMMISQACISVVLPFAVGCLFFLTSKASLMGDERNRPRDMIALTLVMIFALYMSSLAIRGLIEDILSIMG